MGAFIRSILLQTSIMNKSTARKKPAAILSTDQKSQFFIQFIDQIKDEVFLIKQNGQIVFVNKAAAKGLGCSTKKLLARNIFDIFQEDATVKMWKVSKFSAVKESKDPLHYAIKWKTTRRKVQTVETSLSNFDLDGQSFILLIIHQIDQRLQEEHAERELQKNQAIQTLIAGAAQEFQYPIKGIHEKAQALLDIYQGRDFEYIGFKDYKNIFGALKNMRDQAKYCEDTIERLLLFQKKKIKLKVGYCDPNEVLRSIIKAFRDQYGLYQIKIKVKLDSKVKYIAMDEVSFEQIITSVATNAVQAMPNGGEIVLSSKYLKDKDTCLIECKDNGVGIAKDALDHVFDPFFTTKQRGLNKNSGLGLSMVRDIVNRFKGNIMLKSHLRSGTQISIYLPVYKNGKAK